MFSDKHAVFFIPLPQLPLHNTPRLTRRLNLKDLRPIRGLNLRRSAIKKFAIGEVISTIPAANGYDGDNITGIGRDRLRTLRMLSEINWGNFRVKKLFAMDMAVNQVFIWMDWVEIGGVG